MKKSSKKKPIWTDLKRQLADLDRPALLGLIQAPYAASKNNQAFLHARRIYRRLGDQEKYLELRGQQMEYGADYHDLATFYWDSGEKEKALQVAEKGLRKAKGRVDELRAFVTARAEETGDREKYMALQFDQVTDNLTIEKYQAFNKLCSAEEWSFFQPQILLRLKQAGAGNRLKIRMHRQEYDEALAILTKGRYPISAWGGEYEIQAAQKLEKRYPEKILKILPFRTGQCRPQCRT